MKKELFKTRRRDGRKEYDFTYIQVEKSAWKDLRVWAIKHDVTYRIALTMAIYKLIRKRR